MAQSRHIRVFISSTFRDMQAERDHLMRVVFPELEGRCMARGLSFVPVDLRWGVTQAEAESGETLRICLREIEDCRPFFLCLLGERYGWTPLPPEVRGEVAGRLPGDIAGLFAGAYYRNEGYDEYLLRGERQRQETWGDDREVNEKNLLAVLAALGTPAAGQSITAQEIFHGVLRNPDQQMHSLFYFRDPALTGAIAAGQPEGFYEPTEEGREKLAALKRDIREAGLRPQPYADLETLGNVVLEGLWERIIREHPEERPTPADPPAEERLAQELFVGRLTGFFVGREEMLAELDRQVAAANGGWVAVIGLSGCGKTALLANWLYGEKGFVARHPECLVVSHFIGAGTRSANAREILTRLCRELAPAAEWTEELPLEFRELVQTFPKILEAAGGRQPVLLVIDALDQLETADNAHALNWLPGSLPTNVTLLASSLSGDEQNTWPPLHARAGDRLLRVPFFEKPAAGQMIVDYLAQFRKRLSSEQLAALTEKEEIGSPLYLQVALNELLAFGEYEGVTVYLRGLPETVPAIYAFVLEHLEREHGQPFTARVLSCLACGRYGMTEQELLALSVTEGGAVAPLKWARLYRILSPHLLLRGEALGFYHRQLREAVERRYLPEEETRHRTHADIAGYFVAQPLINRRKLEELPWQQALGLLWDDLQATLTDYGFIDAKLRGIGGQSLIEDYKRVYSAKADLPSEPQASLRLIGEALQLSSHVLAQDPNQLPSQLFGRLLGFEDPAVQILLKSAREGHDRLWLRPVTASLTEPGGPLLRTLEGHSDCVWAVAVTSDSRWAISGSWDKTLKVWDLESGAELRTLIGHSSGVFAVAITPDDRLAISGSDDNTLKVWELESGVELCTLTGHRNGVRAVAVTPDGCRVISGSKDGVLKVWDLASGTELCTLPRNFGWVEAVAVTPDGRWVISGSWDKTLKVWDLESGAELRTLIGHSSGVFAVAITPDDRLAISGSDDNTLKVWDWGCGVELHTVNRHRDSLRAVAITPDGRRAISGSFDRTLKVWDLESGAELRNLIGHNAGIYAVAITPDGLRAISTSADETLKVWDLESGVELRTLTGHRRSIKAVAITPDGCRAISGSIDGVLKVWDLASGTELCILPGNHGWVHAVAVTPDGRRAIYAIEGRLKVWELERGTEPRVLIGHSGAVFAVAVTPDGRQAISGSADLTLKVWDLESGVELRTLFGHNNYVDAVAVTPDGRWVISGSADRTLKVWELDSGKILYTFSADVWIRACTVTHGITIVAGDDGGCFHILRLENVTPGPPVCTAWRLPGGGAQAFGCLHCRVWSEVAPSTLGTELPCPHCGKSVKLNPFVINADWRPVAAAWRGEPAENSC